MCVGHFDATCPLARGHSLTGSLTIPSRWTHTRRKESHCVAKLASQQEKIRKPRNTRCEIGKNRTNMNFRPKDSTHAGTAHARSIRRHMTHTLTQRHRGGAHHSCMKEVKFTHGVTPHTQHKRMHANGNAHAHPVKGHTRRGFDDAQFFHGQKRTRKG